MSTEYERTAHSDRSATPSADIPMSEQEARSSSWQEGRENDWAAGESGSRSTEGATDATGTGGASTTADDAERARTTDVDVEPEHVRTTEYDADRSRTADHDAETTSTADYDAETAHPRTADHDAETASAGAADYDAKATQTGTADYKPGTVHRPTADHDAESPAAATDQVPATSTADTDQVTTPDETTTAGNGTEQQRISLDDVGTPLFADTDLDRLRTQWREVQGAFVDSPRDAVTQADKIVADIIYQLTTAYAERKRVLEEHCAGLQDGDTEELRQALRGYRGFFRRLLVIES
ncbi:hypothetical protein NONI108955_37460 [Nocardia ninae]|uniref:Uncharacterized protein n=1 Tax=Nocardia ninae NBRC 108245 TaxID=1210091 RepID=A0A511M719_9NOCA|nr:hypothetical protein [Nocardia ninae]GEM36432.1 hypothetical protein NN4_09510 [Nocardia ninae NBRC 108245]